MLQLDNQSPFEAAIDLFPDEDGVDTLYPLVKATFDLGDRPTVAEEQTPPIAEDAYRGNPATTSLLAAGELHLAKPGTDVILTGHARSPDARPVDRLDVRLAAGRLEKTVRVFGDRRWIGGMTGPTPSKPRPFTAMPLVWERAFGGCRETAGGELEGEPRNPVGRGFRGRRKRREMVGEPLPNLEEPGDLLAGAGDRPAPAAFGPLAPSWAPRAGYAGTYDEAWQAERCPYLPLDFDRRFFCYAAPGLTSSRPFEGGEPVRVENVSPRGPLAFLLPRCRLEAEVELRRGIERPPLVLETVAIDADAERLTLLWRAALPCDKRALTIERVTIRLLALELAADGVAR